MPRSSLRKPTLRTGADRDALILQFQYLPRFVANRIGPVPGFQYDDLVQVGFLALMRAAELWNPRLRRGGAKFITYATKSIWSRINVVTRHIYHPLPVSDVIDVDTLTTSDQEYDDAVELLHRAIAELPERMQVIIQGRFFRHELLEEIGRRLRLSKERVRQLQNQALTRLRERMVGTDARTPIDHTAKTGNAARTIACRND